MLHAIFTLALYCFTFWPAAGHTGRSDCPLCLAEEAVLTAQASQEADPAPPEERTGLGDRLREHRERNGVQTKEDLDRHRRLLEHRRQKFLQERRELIAKRHPLVKSLFRIGDFCDALIVWMKLPGQLCLYLFLGIVLIFLLLLVSVFRRR